MKQGPLKSIFGDGRDKGKATMEGRHPPEFHEVLRKYVTMLRTNLDANKVHSLAVNKVACPMLQVQSCFIPQNLLTSYSVDGARDRSGSRILG